MFNLETAISAWRKQMLAAGIQSPVPLEELECHLREDIEQHLRAGASEARAFEMAVRSIGPAAELKKELIKAENFKLVILRKLRHFLLGVRDIPLLALDDFEPEARQTLQFAPEEARRFNHNFIGTEHILLGLMQSGSGTLSSVMQKLGLNCDSVRLEIERTVGSGPVANVSAIIPYTPRARQALQLALAEAKKLNARQVKAEHIFLGLLREGGGVAALVLKNFSVRLESARAEVLKEMTRHPEAGSQ